MAIPDKTKYPHFDREGELTVRFKAHFYNRFGTPQQMTVEVYKDLDGESQVNWCAIGSVNTADADVYAKLILEASEYAKELNR